MIPDYDVTEQLWKLYWATKLNHSNEFLENLKDGDAESQSSSKYIT